MTALLHRQSKNSAQHLAATLRAKLDQKYASVLSKAASEWDRKFAGKDPSDACVTVRIAPRAQDFRRVA